MFKPLVFKLFKTFKNSCSAMKMDFSSQWVVVGAILIVVFPLIVLWFMEKFLRSTGKAKSFLEICMMRCSRPLFLLVSLWISFLIVRTAEYPAELRGVDVKSLVTFCLEFVIYLCLVWLYSTLVDAVFLWMRFRVPESGMEETFDVLASWASSLLKALGFAIVFIVYLGLTSLFFSEEASTFRKAIASVVVGSIVIATVFLRQIAMSYLYLAYIIWEGHFSIGDEVVIYERDQGTARGVVAAVDAHFTHLVGTDGTLCLVPNLLVVKGMLTKTSRTPAQLCLEVPCALHYDTTNAQIENFIAAAKICAATAVAGDPRVRMLDSPMQPGGVGLTVRKRRGRGVERRGSGVSYRLGHLAGRGILQGGMSYRLWGRERGRGVGREGREGTCAGS
jgi:hypothetical protein